MKNVVKIATFTLLLTACKGSNIYGSKSQITQIPTTFEKPEVATTAEQQPDDQNYNYDDLNLPAVNPSEVAQVPKAKEDDKHATAPSTIKPKDPVKPVVTTPNAKPPTTTVTTPPATTTSAPVVPQQSKTLLETAAAFLKNTKLVMINEGKKIGKYCNFFLQRILEVSGFPKDPFLANDFDVYAEKNFAKPYTKVDFKNTKADQEKLKQLIWSHPEGTPFIFQWSKSGMHGHVAVVVRSDDKLIIYQASLNQYSARSDQTKIETLLNDYSRRLVTVYADFTRK